MSTIKSSSANLTLNADGSGNDILFQSNASQVGSLTAEGLLTVTGGITMTGTTPTLTIGDAGAEDTKIVFDGNAQDWHIGLDDSADDFVIGLGSTLGTTSHIVIDETGAVTKPLQPAFLAAMSSTQSNIAAGGGFITVLFNSEIFDQNADYNTGTYTFTAPVTGRYQLNLNCFLQHLDSASGYYKLMINTSNRSHYNYVDARGLSNDPDQWTMTLAVLADMDAGDTSTCTIKQLGGTSQVDVYQLSTFSGHLAC
jgi:hypothetical protein